MRTISNGELEKQKLSSRPQFNVRLPVDLKDKMDTEIQRQGRKRDAVAIRVFAHFLSLRQAERDAICAKAA